ncbi:response regulator [Hydrogenimonas sp.]
MRAGRLSKARGEGETFRLWHSYKIDKGFGIIEPVILNVLIVEDEVVIALHIEHVVKAAGHRVVGIATNADEALQQADEQKVDLVISDIRLRESRDGIEVSGEIQLEHGCAVILITAYKDQETLKKALNIELDGYLVKPFNEEELRMLLQKVAGRYRQT